MGVAVSDSKALMGSLGTIDQDVTSSEDGDE